MRRIKKIPEPNPNTEKKLLQSGWQRLREPRSLKLAIALALPIGFVLMALAAWWAAWLLDGGPTPGPVPSTIVSLAGGSPGPVVVREGVVPRAELAAVVGPSAAHGGAKEGAGA